MFAKSTHDWFTHPSVVSYFVFLTQKSHNGLLKENLMRGVFQCSYMTCHRIYFFLFCVHRIRSS